MFVYFEKAFKKMRFSRNSEAALKGSLKSRRLERALGQHANIIWKGKHKHVCVWRTTRKSPCYCEAEQ